MSRNPLSESSSQGFQPVDPTYSEQKDSPSTRASSPLRHGGFRLNKDRLVMLRKFILIDINLPRVLLDAGILSYVMFTIKMLWKYSVMYRSQPRTAGVGFIAPSVVMYGFVQRYSPSCRPNNATRIGILQAAAVEVTILAGSFICTFILVVDCNTSQAHDNQVNLLLFDTPHRFRAMRISVPSEQIF
ncbi:hypothetical protein FB446DRAFT_796797 [Lentinula raphanica]|nr:hypothetical protein FB446DRAFT_796797 [Lentinula raphanica]